MFYAFDKAGNKIYDYSDEGIVETYRALIQDFETYHTKYDIYEHQSNHSFLTKKEVIDLLLE